MNQFKWYILRTKAGQEKKVSLSLKRNKIINFYPVTSTSINWLGVRNQTLSPLFPAYVFVYVDAIQFKVALRIKGVLNYLYWLSMPAVITQGEINVLRQLLNENKDLQLQLIRFNVQGKMEIMIFPTNFSKSNYSSINIDYLMVSLPPLSCSVDVLVS